MPCEARISSFDPKEGIIYIKDPVHSYVSVTEPSSILDGQGDSACATELDLLSTPWLQRLRRIHQTQSGFTVFPGLEHSRFQHVIGVMHLAGRMARKWYGQLIRRLQELDRQDLYKASPASEYVEEVFRLAGLLHDVGHGPFSHSLDSSYQEVYGDQEITHEYVSILIVERKLADIISKIRRSPSGKFEQTIDPRVIAWLIHPSPRQYTEREYFWLRALRPIISGLYDADALDYLTRDAYHGGLLEYGLLDIDRFVENTFLVFGDEPGEIGIYLHRNSLPALEHLLLSRFQMYQACYFHKSVRAFDLRARELLSKLLRKLAFPSPKLDPEGFLKRLLGFDEYYIFGQSTSWMSSKDVEVRELGEAWGNFAGRKHGLTLVHSRDYLIHEWLTVQLVRYIETAYLERLRGQLTDWQDRPDSELTDDGFSDSELRLIREEEVEAICGSVTFDTPILDLRRGINPLNIKGIVRIYDPRHPGQPDDISVERIIERLPIRFLPLRAYSRRRDLSGIIGRALDIVSSQISHQATSY